MRRAIALGSVAAGLLGAVAATSAQGATTCSADLNGSLPLPGTQAVLVEATCATAFAGHDETVGISADVVRDSRGVRTTHTVHLGSEDGGGSAGITTDCSAPPEERGITMGIVCGVDDVLSGEEN